MLRSQCVSEGRLLEIGQVLDGSVRVLNVLLRVLGLESVSLLVLAVVDESEEAKDDECDSVKDSDEDLAASVIGSVAEERREERQYL